MNNINLLLKEKSNEIVTYRLFNSENLPTSFIKTNKVNSDLEELSSNDKSALTKLQEQISYKKQILRFAKKVISKTLRLLGLMPYIHKYVTNKERFASIETELDRLRNQASELRVYVERYPKLNLDYHKFELMYRYVNKEEGKQKFAHYLNHFDQSFPDDYILDIGCGDGLLLEMLSELGYKNLYGIEPDHSMFMSKTNSLVNISEKTFHDFFANNMLKYHCIIAAHVVEHLVIQDLIDLIKLSYKNLHFGGKLILETPNVSMLGTLAASFYTDVTHKFPYSKDAIKFLLVNVGFKEENIEIRFGGDVSVDSKLSITADMSDTEKRNINKINNILFGMQDLIVIAKK